MTNDFTICVLLYGDFLGLADRCLRSIAETVRQGDLNLRVGLNACGEGTKQWVKSWVPPECIWESDENIHKYPMMRQMIHGVAPVETPFTMWFDDDSYLDGFKLQQIAPGDYWLNRVEHAMVNSDMIGSVYGIDLQGHQADWIKDQAWYNNKNPVGRKVRFATGGWWTIRTEILYGWDYPWTELDHRGGDVMLGEMCYQQGFRLNHFRDGVKINANEKGMESKAERRGFDSKPIGYYYDPGVAQTVARATDMPPIPKRPPIIEL